MNQAERVAAELRGLMVSAQVAVVIASAASGADLLALQAAGELGIRRVVVLPCAALAFKVGSVTDRPGDWGPLFDRIIDEVRGGGSLIELDLGQDAEAYAQVTKDLIERAQNMAEGEGLTAAAVAVWDGVSHGPEDMTAYFRRLAAERRFDLHEIRTFP
ncbi:MAG: hypothetical protein ABIO37_09790 [Caulobacteraceae bacterium]